MAPKIGVQLYSVREQSANDYEGTIRKIVQMGYRYVEPAGYPGSTIAEAAKIFQRYGLQALSCHGKLPIGKDKNQAIEEAQIIGAKYIISGCCPEDFKTVDKIRAVADIWTGASANATEHGIQVGYHNHDWEMFDVDGRPGYQILMNNTPEEVLMQVDTYWVFVGGKKPVDIIKEVGPRGKVLHIKDGPGDKTSAMQPLGTGKMDFPPILEVADYAELLIVELDSCDIDMMEALKQSYDYLLGIGTPC